MPRFQSVNKPDPVFVSYYTEGTDYEEGAMRLIESMRQFGVAYDVMPIRDQGGWAKNCQYKAKFVHDMWNDHMRPICWVDADAVFKSSPDVLTDYAASRKVDFAIWPTGNESNPDFNSGTVFFNRTERASRLLTLWIEESEKPFEKWTASEKRTPDQVFLKTAWARLLREGEKVVTAWLPQAYCKIYTCEQENSGIPDTIVHYQFSRKNRT